MTVFGMAAFFGRLAASSGTGSTVAVSATRLPPSPLSMTVALTFCSALRASSRSFTRRAMTRVAASCMYSAWLSSWRTVWRLWRSVCVSSISASHSS
eukprot:366462-Chlamydomonas_euryale.AAC.16